MSEIAIGIIGGSGLYEMAELENRRVIETNTPFGRPSAAPVTGTIGGKRVAFIARHGTGHTFTPSEINYRANICALKSLGVRFILAVSACGSLKEAIAPGHAVVPDQLVDFTRGIRQRSFFGEGVVAHVSSAEPFCPYLRGIFLDAAGAAGAERVHDGGKFLTIEGPRFSTRGESALYRAWGLDIIGMTTSPEAFLAREAQMSYAVLAHVTDYDVWHKTPVSNDMVVRTFRRNIGRTKQTLLRAVELVRTDQDTEAQHALEGAVMTGADAMDPAARERLALLLGEGR